MSCNESWFENLKIDESKSSKVVLGDNNTQEVNGSGVVSIQAKDGQKKLIHNVLHVPALKKNLLSVAQMMEQNYRLEFDNGECLIKDKKNRGAIVAKGELTKDRLFKLVLSPKSTQALTVKVEDESSLWHKRLGHLNYDSIILLRRKEMVTSLPFVGKKSDICEGCVLGK